jgi:Transposase DDE domain
MGSPTGREPQGDGVAVVLRGRESRPHGEGRQAVVDSAIRGTRDADSQIAQESATSLEVSRRWYDTGEPDAPKGARPVRRGGDGKVPATATRQPPTLPYCSPILRQFSRDLGHVPLIDHNPRRGEKIEFAPHEAQRYKTRTQVERANARLKDEFGADSLRVRGHAKVTLHLMLGVLVLAADQLLRLLKT